MPARSMDDVPPLQPIDVDAVSTDLPKIAEVSALAYQ